MSQRETPTVSVLMPAFNPGKYGLSAVNSVLAALGSDDELVVQDNDSTDGWFAGLPPDPRIALVRERDSGQADALNRALSRARGEWVLWVNADDMIDPQGYRKVVATLQPGVDVVYADFATIDAEARRIRRFTPGVVTANDLVRKGCIVFNGSMFLRRELLEAVGGFAPDFHYTMDYELFMRVWKTLEHPPAYVPCVVGSLRLHGTTKSAEHPWRFVREARKARMLHYSTLRASSARQTFLHALTVATTRLREARAYRAARRLTGAKLK